VTEPTRLADVLLSQLQLLAAVPCAQCDHPRYQHVNIDGVPTLCTHGHCGCAMFEGRAHE
jgi:hypothetical protein